MAVPTTAAPTTSPKANLAALMAPRETPLHSGARLRAVPNDPFFLVHDPLKVSCWEVVKVGDKAVVVPVLNRMVLAAGINGIRILRQGESRPERAYEEEVIRRKTRGQIVLDASSAIPTECLPAGVPAGGYLREMPCEMMGRSGTYHVEAWQIPLPTGEGERQRFAWDRPSYNLWRAWLVATERIPAPAAHVLAALQTSAQDRLEGIEARTMQPDAKERKLREARERADLADAAVGAAAEGAAE